MRYLFFQGTRYIVLFWIIAFALHLMSSSSLAVDSHNVLVLHSYHKGLSWTDSLVQGIEEGLQEKHPYIEMCHEFMDTKHIFSEKYLEKLRSLYYFKYVDKQPDLIISSDDHAFSFLRRYHAELFPDIPVVFTGVNNYKPEMLASLPLFTGIVEAFDIEATVELIFTLHPAVKRIVVIADQTLTGQTNKKLFKNTMERASRSVELEFLDNHTIAEVRNRVSQLSSDSVAFWLTFTSDRNGEYFSFRKSASLISEVSQVPIYSLWDFHLGYGITGGRLASGYYQGKTAATVASRILDGTPVSEIPVLTESPNRFMFDFKELQRFAIDSDLLPKDSIIINRSQTLYSQYKSIVWFSLLAFISLSIIILLLFSHSVQRRRKDMAVRAARDHFQRIFNKTPVALLEVDLSTLRNGLKDSSPSDDNKSQIWQEVEVIDCNNAALALYGTNDKTDFLQLLGATLPLFSREVVHKVGGGSLSNNATKELEWEVSWKTQGGKALHLLMRMSPFGHSIGATSEIISAVDITERKQYLEELHNSETRFRTLFDSAGSGIAVLDIIGEYHQVNDALCSMFGYEKHEFRGMNWRDITHPDDIKLTERSVSDLLEGNIVASFEKRWIHKSGRTLWGLLNIGKTIEPDGRTSGFIAQIQDITERKADEDRMRLKDQRYRQMFEADLSGFYIAHPKGKILLCNQVFAEMLGFAKVSDMVGRNISPYFRQPELWKNQIEDVTEQKKVENSELELLKNNGERLVVLCNYIGRFNEAGELLEVQGHMMDISQQKTLEGQLMRAQKMEAIGLMAAGVAHDLNNILSGIINYPELLLAQVGTDSSLCKPLEAIKESGHRAAAVVADLLTVARSAAKVREVWDLETLVQEYIDSPECNSLRTIHPEVDLQYHGEDQQTTILCSPVHIKKCLMNLVTNAMEAIEREGLVDIRISTKTIADMRDDKEVDVDFVVLTVTDDGPGISHTDLEYIFEPFYTKKVMGRSGTGLGLAVVWNTVHDHGGKINVESGSDGTSFTLMFPTYEQVEVTAVKQTEMMALQGSGEHILVVDDEPVLRDIASQILATLGYKVDAVSSGEEALQFMMTQSVDLILLDMLMDPGMNGAETYARIIKRSPKQKAIIVSGYSKSNDVKKAIRLGVGGFIEKPYSIEQLGQAVSAELERTV